MNDRFKFRVWDGKEMIMPPVMPVLDPVVIGLCGTLSKVEGENLANDTAKPLRFFVPGSVTLMQSTGLKDRNGTLIYEGDIVEERFTYLGYREGEMDIEVSRIYEVKFQELDRAIGFNLSPEHSFEIIGNLYENPELLNQQENENN